MPARFELLFLIAAVQYFSTGETQEPPTWTAYCWTSLNVLIIINATRSCWIVERVQWFKCGHLDAHGKSAAVATRLFFFAQFISDRVCALRQQ